MPRKAIKVPLEVEPDHKPAGRINEVDGVDYFSRLPPEVMTRILAHCRPRKRSTFGSLARVVKSITPIARKFLYRNPQIDGGAFGLFLRSMIEGGARATKLGALVCGLRLDLTREDFEFEEDDPFEYQLIGLFKRLPQLEGIHVSGQAISEWLLSYPFKTLTTLSNLKALQLDGVPEGLLQSLLSSYSSIVTLRLKTVQGEELGNPCATKAGGRGLLFQPRPFKFVSLEVKHIINNIRRFLDCISCESLSIHFSFCDHVGEQLLPVIDGSQLTSLVLHSKEAAELLSVDLDPFIHLKTLSITGFTLDDNFLAAIIGDGTPLILLSSLVYVNSTVRKRTLYSLIKCLKSTPRTLLSIKKVSLSTIKFTAPKDGGSRRPLWDSECRKDDMVELLRLGAEKEIEFAGDNVEGVKREQRSNERRWS